MPPESLLSGATLDPSTCIGLRHGRSGGLAIEEDPNSVANTDQEWEPCFCMSALRRQDHLGHRCLAVLLTCDRPLVMTQVLDARSFGR